jgi:TRAP-type C4-dicarboxylate transport system substrate-binding protein
MNNRSTRTGVIAAGLFGMVLASSAIAQTTVRASSWHPPKHPGVVGGYEPFIKYVEEKSGGSLEFKLWTGGSLLGPQDMLPGVQNGIADIGVLALTYFQAEFPYAQLLSNLGMLSDNPPAIAAAVTEMVMLECEPCRAEYADLGLVFTSAYSTTPYVMISRDKLDAPEDLEGKTYRSAGTVWDRYVEYVGGTPVNVSSAEIFEALDRGGVDAAVFAASGLESFSLWDVADYVNMLPLGTYAAMSLFTMNRGFWGDLTDEERRVMLDGAAIGAVRVTQGYIDSDKRALNQAEEHGVTVVQPSDALRAQLAEFLEQDLLGLEKIAAERYNIDDAAHWIAKFRVLLEKWKGISAANNGDPDMMIQAMRDEIYSKVDEATYGLQ